MANYVCTQLVENTCQSWQEFHSVIDMLAITGQQRDEILLSILALWFGAYIIRQVLNVVLRRRY